MYRVTTKFFAILLLIGSLYLQACKDIKNIKPATEMNAGEISSSQGVDIQTPHGLIRFKNARLQMSIQTYENILERLEIEDIEDVLKNTNFVSLKKYFENNPNLAPELREVYEGTLISALLNTNGILQLNQWILRIDKANERVLVLQENHESQINDLINGNTSNPNIQVFSTDDDVISILEGNEQRGIFCGDRRAKEKRDLSSYDIPLLDNHKLKCVVAYIKLGVYFELKSRVIYLSGFFRRKANLSILYQYKHQGRCKNNQIIEGNSYIECNASGWCNRYAGTYTIKHYRWNQALQNYFLASTFMVSDEGVNYVIPRYHVIRDGF
ncbi:MAG: hypothetical protein NZ516_01320 [Raineya sp.]|nr:hypothetical protein [Raineya sp.]